MKTKRSVYGKQLLGGYEPRDKLSKHYDEYVKMSPNKRKLVGELWVPSGTGSYVWYASRCDICHKLRRDITHFLQDGHEIDVCLSCQKTIKKISHMGELRVRGRREWRETSTDEILANFGHRLRELEDKLNGTQEERVAKLMKVVTECD